MHLPLWAPPSPFAYQGRFLVPRPLGHPLGLLRIYATMLALGHEHRPWFPYLGSLALESGLCSFSVRRCAPFVSRRGIPLLR